MDSNDKTYNEQIELPPHDWLSWSDEKFNQWRRLNDFPRILKFLFDSLPYFSLWLSEQRGLTKDDLLFNGPARFIRFYGEPVIYVEHDISINLSKKMPVEEKVRCNFIKYKDANKRIENLKVVRSVKFLSYIDWAFSNSGWAFPKKINDIRDIARCFTPRGMTSDTSDYLNSNSNIALNIPLFMPNIHVSELGALHAKKAPPKLELLKLGGQNIEVVRGVIGEKNLEFTNIDNLTLVSPMVTSFQSFIFSTLRNVNIIGSIHGATFHQCSVGLSIKDGSLSECNFEYGDSKIELHNSVFDRSSIKERELNVKLKDSDVTSCVFEYSDMLYFSAKDKKSFHNSAKMMFSHLGYPDLAGEHFFVERKSERKMLWGQFFSSKKDIGLKTRISSLFASAWMCLQELYWGYGERPFHIIFFSLFFIFALSLFGFFSHCSSTYLDFGKSVIFSFQSFTNISISEIKQSYEVINLIGAFMSFFGLISVGLLVAALSAKTKNYN